MTQEQRPPGHEPEGNQKLPERVGYVPPATLITKGNTKSKLLVAPSHLRSRLFLMSVTLTEKYRLLARLFTRPVFSTIAATGEWERGLEFLVRAQVLQPGPLQSVSDLFESAWKELRAFYRNEYVYKTELANRVVFGRHSPRTTALHVELPVARSIVDIAVFNGTSTAYEVKTEFDSARRLQTQTTDYLKVFDKVFVVAHPSAASAYANLVDERVGVLALGASGSFSLTRDAIPNKKNVAAATIFRCLRRAEYVEIIEEMLRAPLRYPNGLIARKCEEAFCRLTSEQAHQHFVNALRRRHTDPLTVEFVSHLPQSLRALGYATPLSVRQRATAISVLGQEIDVAIA